jgi:hypothetical protein
VQYPLDGDQTVDVVRFGFDQVPTPAQVRAIAAIFGTKESTDGVLFTGALESTGQPTYLEQFSPRDFYGVYGPTMMAGGELLALIESLTFGTFEELDVDVRELDDTASEVDVVLQAEEPWGRWQITESVSGGERCFGLGVNVWTDLDGAQSSHPLVCQPESDERPGPMCLDLQDGR